MNSTIASKTTDSLLELQRQRAVAIAAQESAHARARSAAVAFDADPSAEPELLAADAELERTALHVARVDRLLVAARERDARAEEQAKEERIRVLEAQVSHATMKAAAAPFIERELALLTELARVRSEAAKTAADFEGKHRLLHGLKDIAPVTGCGFGMVITTALAWELEVAADELEDGDPVRAELLRARRHLQESRR